jgi:hypothetical protein
MGERWADQWSRSWSARPILPAGRTTTEKEATIMTCQRCYGDVYECSDCDGQTKKSLLGDTLSCSTCRSTGYVCPQDGGYWQ